MRIQLTERIKRRNDDPKFKVRIVWKTEAKVEVQSTGLFTRTLVAEQDRINILPKYVGGGMWLVMLETSILGALKSMCGSYSGGHWEMAETSNGAFFMWPRMEAERADGRLGLTARNGNYRIVSTEAAGITATLYGLNRMCWSTGSAAHVDLYEALRDFAREHDEWPEICDLTD
jgi:hypothetical protein